LQSEAGFRRILVAVDGSPVSMRAVDQAARVAKHEKGELIALHVVPKPYPEVVEDYASYYEEARKKVRVWMRDVEVTASRHGVTIRTEIIVDASSILEAIIGYAERHNVDLIVAGTRGKTPSQRLRVGSVATGLVTYSSCPVLIIR